MQLLERKYNETYAFQKQSISYGNHKVKITYQDKGLILGIGFSFIGLVGFGFSIVYYNKLENLIFDSKKRKHK